jgi:hypothetical protein
VGEGHYVACHFPLVGDTAPVDDAFVAGAQVADAPQP